VRVMGRDDVYPVKTSGSVVTTLCHSRIDIFTGYTSSRLMTRTSGCYYSFLILLMMGTESVRNM